MTTRKIRFWLALTMAGVLCSLVLGITVSPGVTETNITWETEVVDGEFADVGAFTSVALDGNDDPVISYYDTTNADLKAAQHDGSQWQIEIVDSNAPNFGAAEGTAVALNSAGLPRIAYHRAATYTLHLATLKESSWILTVAAQDAGQYPDLVLDSSGVPHFSHYKLTDQDLVYTYYGKGGWVDQVVDSAGNVGLYTSIALDSTGVPHIAYYDATHGDLRYAVLGTSDWTTSTIDNSGDVGKGASLSIDSNDFPVISYIDTTNSALKIARIEEKVWVTGTIDSTPTEIGDYTSLALDSYDRPHIAYEVISKGTSSLQYTHFQGTTWIRSTVDSSGSVGRYPSIAIDSSNSPVISYYDVTNGDLKIARETVLIPPDLVITDIWHEGSVIWYQVMNSGAGDAAAGHHTSVDVDGGSGKNDYVTEELGPGGRTSRQFSDSWICTGTTDTVEVCADSYAEIVESNEGNNCRQETWGCDTQAPIITTGPAIFALSSTHATIVWTTDEFCSGSIDYGTLAGISGEVAGGLTPNTTHEVTISGLTPSTRYRYVAICTDTGDNTVRSKPGTFETLSPSGNIAPTITDVTVSLVDGYAEYYTVDVEANDDYGVDNVSFYLDGELLGTDHASSSPFRAAIHPVLLALNQDDFYTPHVISVTVTDDHGATDTWSDTWMPSGEPNIEAVWHSPRSTVYIDGPVGTAAESYDIAVSTYYVYRDCHNRVVADIPSIRLNDLASLGHMRIEGAVIGVRESRPAPVGLSDLPMSATGVTAVTLCDETRVPAQSAKIYMNDVLIDNTNDMNGYHISSANLNGMAAGNIFTLSVAINDDGTWIPVPQIRQIMVLQGQPDIEIEREVTRSGNAFDIALTVTNIGTESLHNLSVRDNIRGFQPIERQQSFYTVTVTALNIDQALRWWVALTSHSHVVDPGESFTMVYQAVPVVKPGIYHGTVLIEDRYDIGGSALEVDYTGADGTSYQERYSVPCAWTEDHIYLDQSAGLAMQASDYLIITDPLMLKLFEPRTITTNTTILMEESSRVNRQFSQLMSTMGEFARRKNGIIGYVNGDDRHETDNLIEEWGSRMRCSYVEGEQVCDFNRSQGYLLIVGEMQVVAPFAPRMEFYSGWQGSRLTPTDREYADIAGDVDNPELAAGRIIGNSLGELMYVLETSIRLDNGDPGYGFDRSDALLVRGFDECRSGGCDHADYGEVIMDAWRWLEVHGTQAINYLRTSNYDTITDTARVVITATRDMDIIVLAGHGNVAKLDDLKTKHVLWWGIPQHDPFWATSPVVYTVACLTGLYDPIQYLQDEVHWDEKYTSVAEAFLLRGAGAYIGATTSTRVLAGPPGINNFFKAWEPGVSAGRALRYAKWKVGTDNAGNEDQWSAATHLYGDPKIGLGAFPPAATSLQLTGPSTMSLLPNLETGGAAPTTLDLIVPDYEVSTDDAGQHRVDLPDGMSYVELGQPLVPRYATIVDIPEGHRIQDVTLTDRSGLTETTGLILPIATTAEDSNLTYDLTASSVVTDTGWWPEEDYVWEVIDNGGGSTSLMITVYPFLYNSLTTDARFYKNYSFDITTVTTTVDITYLATSARAVAQEENVTVELWLDSSGPALDVVVQAVIVKDGSGEIVDGLLLQTLDNLEGAASFTLDWITTGFAPGDYTVEVELRNTLGELLDREMVQVTLGITEGKVAGLTVSPIVFNIGDSIDISMAFSNTGTLPITGTAVVDVQGGVAIFTQTIEGLEPGSTFTLTGTWDTSGVERGDYRVMGTVYYDARAAEPIAVTVTTERRIFLPIVVRQN